MPPRLDPGAPEGAELMDRQDAALDRYDLPVGPFTGEARPVRPLEGQVVRSAWRAEGAERTPEEVIEGFRTRLAELGFEPVFACRDRECGGFDFRFGVELMPAPAMLMDTADFSYLAMAAPDGRYASVLASRVLDAVHVQTVVVEGREAEPLPAPPLPQPAAVEGGEPARPGGGDPEAHPMDQSVLHPSPEPGAATPRAFLEALRRQGHAAVAGLSFDSGGATLSADSAAALDRLARLLEEEPDMQLAIVGHSDNVGRLEPNVALSRRRAEAVRRALVERGIAPDRLEAHGVGWLAPVASNLTEEGRGINRRVEVVVK